MMHCLQQAINAELKINVSIQLKFLKNISSLTMYMIAHA